MAQVERGTSGSKKLCMVSIIVFFVILGVAFGVIFGVIPTDFMPSLFGNDSNSESDGGGDNTGGNGAGTGGGVDATDPPSPSPTAADVSPTFTFMQCPEVGECCNGLQSSCDLSVSEFMWPTVHNAMHDGLLGNNDAPLEEALEAGYRGLLLDVCWCADPNTQVKELIFCHSVCGVGERKFGEVISNINTFLDNNPTEVILINYEISFGDPTPAEIWTAMTQQVGIKEKTYIHRGGDFPTMRSLLQDSKQLLLFKHNGLSCLDTSLNGCTPRIPEFFKYAVETPYNFDSVAAIENDPSTSCKIDRGLDATPDFYHINNFVTKWSGPSVDASKTINERSFLENRISECEKVTKLNANMVSIDFWQQGDLLEVAQDINKERAKRRRSLRERIYNWIH